MPPDPARSFPASPPVGPPPAAGDARVAHSPGPATRVPSAEPRHDPYPQFPAGNGAEGESQGQGREPTAESGGWLQALKSRLGFDGAPTLRDALEDALAGEAKTTSVFTEQERGMLLRILRFGGLRVDDVKVPRVDIVAIDEREPISALVRLFTDAEVSRIPVYRETLDDPRGMIHIKDLMIWIVRESGGQAPKTAANDSGAATPLNNAPLSLAGADLSRPIAATRLNRPMLFVPPSMPAVNLLLRMQSTRVHLAMVVDEHGGTDGLVSIEDLVEQIVGEIEDEHDEDDRNLVTDPKLGLIAAARTPIKELEAHLGLSLADATITDDVTTLGGLIYALIGRIPVRGELVPHPAGVEFEVLDADPRHLKRLKIHVRKAV